MNKNLFLYLVGIFIILFTGYSYAIPRVQIKYRSILANTMFVEETGATGVLKWSAGPGISGEIYYGVVQWGADLPELLEHEKIRHLDTETNNSDSVMIPGYGIERTYDECHWIFDYYGITGIVNWSEGVEGYDEIVSIGLGNDPNEPDFDWHLTKEIRYRIRADEFPDNPGQNIPIMPVLTSFDENSYTNGYLHAEDKWYPDGYYSQSELARAANTLTIPADIDVFSIDDGKGIYCIETKRTGTENLSTPLEITAYEANGDSFGIKKGGTNVFNVYDETGEVDGKTQRVYCKVDSKAFIEIKSTDSDKELKYAVRIFRSRPIILIHGISCLPKIIDDIKRGRNSMGNWKDCLPWDGNTYPSLYYDFRWNTEIHDLISDDTGKIIEIVDCSPDINPSVVKLEANHNMNVIIIAHSMGGFIARYALEEKPNMIDKVILLASPMYGSDIAHVRINWLKQKLKDTSEHNLKMLQHGSELVLAMDKWDGKEKCLCIAGEGASSRIKVNIITKILIGFHYDRGLHDSDGVVPVCSATLRGAHENIVFERDHATIALSTYVKESNKYTINPPSVFIEALKMIVGYSNPCTYRWPKKDVFNNEIYKATRNYIKE